MSSSQSKIASSTLKHLSIFQDISEPVLNMLIKQSKVLELQSQKRDYQEFQIEDKVYLLVAGKVFLSCIDKDGKKIIAENLGIGNFFGNLDSLDQSAARECAFIEPHPRTQALILEFQREYFFNLLGENPKLALKVILNFSGRISKLEQKVEEVALYDLETRLLTELVRLGEVSGESKTRIILDQKITHERLAQITGSVREAVSKIMSRFKKLGVISYDHNRRPTLNIAERVANTSNLGY